DGSSALDLLNGLLEKTGKPAVTGF
ncbi:MAG: hypothetical protein QOH79_2128, partial [Acidimicrobiaceae bacterium]